MWPFKRSKGKQVVEDLSERYRRSPINIFFEALILDVLGKLPREREAAIESMKLQQVLGTTAVTWREAVRETLSLSNTIDIAILDLWYVNSEAARKSGVDYEPEHFARDFADKYFEEGSRVDVWPGDALQQAKFRIARHQIGI